MAKNVILWRDILFKFHFRQLFRFECWRHSQNGYMFYFFTLFAIHHCCSSCCCCSFIYLFDFFSAGVRAMCSSSIFLHSFISLSDYIFVYSKFSSKVGCVCVSKSNFVLGRNSIFQPMVQFKCFFSAKREIHTHREKAIQKTTTTCKKLLEK